MSSPAIRRLGPDDAALYLAQRRQALAAEPLAFLASPEDDVASGVEEMRRRLDGAPDAVVLGAFDGGLVGSIGVYREPRLKSAHKARVWGMYVAPSHRRRGVARRLVEEAIRHARLLDGVLQVHLSVTEAAPAARLLYESLGFRVWGREPRSLHHLEAWVGEDHMVLLLDAPGGGS